MARFGAITLFLLCALGLFLAVLGLVVEGAKLWSARQELQIAADAAALAGVQALADDRLLAVPPMADAQLLEESRIAAVRAALANPVHGSPCVLPANPANAVEGPLVFGYLDDAARRGFHPALPGLTVEGFVNAVRVRTERSASTGNSIPLFLGRLSLGQGVDVQATAVAMLDRDVVGFQPSSTANVPLMPLALFSDPTDRHPASWEAQTAAGRDRFGFNRQERRFFEISEGTARGNGLFEMTVRLPLAGATFTSSSREEEPNGTLLLFRAALANDADTAWPHQILHGLTAADVLPASGSLVLPENGQLPLPGMLTAPDLESTLTKNLVHALRLLAEKTEPRAYPLYQQVSMGAPGEPARVIVTGFVAARLVRVEVRDQPYPHLELILEPCQLVTATAVTDAGRRHQGMIALPNHHLAKARLVR